MDRVALITGGGGAIGRAIGARLARDGVRVALAGLDAGAAEVAAADIANAIGLHLDVTDKTSVQATVAQVVERFGRLDVVVNNAGLNRPGGTADVSEEAWQAVLDVNLTGALLVCQAALPHMQGQRYGRIVNIASRAWLSGGPPAYAASKAGLIGLTHSMARELAPWDITVNAVAPSTIATPFTQAGRSAEEFEAMAKRYVDLTPLGRLATPEDVAAAVAFFASEEAGFVTGEVLHVCGGIQLPPA